MAEDGPATLTVCATCSAVVLDVVKHLQWHNTPPSFVVTGEQR